MEWAMENLKHSVWVLWFGSLGAMIFGDGMIATAGILGFAGTAVAHLGEFVWKRSMLEQAGGEMSSHFIGTMIYGLFHWMPLEKEQQNPD